MTTYSSADPEVDPEAAFEVGVQLAGEDRLAEAEQAFARADDAGHAAAAFNLGVLLAYRGDVAGAEAAYLRAYERGLADAAFELGSLFLQQSRLEEAEAAFAAADEQGHGPAAAKLGVLLEERGDLDGAAAAYFRADERGDADGAFDLAMLLAQHDQLAEAEEAFARAAERGHDAAAHNLAVVREYRESTSGAYPQSTSGAQAAAETAGPATYRRWVGGRASQESTGIQQSTPAVSVNLAAEIVGSRKRHGRRARLPILSGRRRVGLVALGIAIGGAIATQLVMTGASAQHSPTVTKVFSIPAAATHSAPSSRRSAATAPRKPAVAEKRAHVKNAQQRVTPTVHAGDQASSPTAPGVPSSGGGSSTQGAAGGA